MSDDTVTTLDAETAAAAGTAASGPSDAFFEATASWRWPGSTIEDNEALIDELLAAEPGEQGALVATDDRLARLYIIDSLHERALSALLRGDRQARRIAELAFELTARTKVVATPIEEVHEHFAESKMFEALAWLLEDDLEEARRALELMSALEIGSNLTGCSGDFAVARALHALACGSREEAVEILTDSLGDFAREVLTPNRIRDAQVLLENVRRGEMTLTPNPEGDEETAPLRHFFAVWLAIERRLGSDPMLARLREMEEMALSQLRIVEAS